MRARSYGRVAEVSTREVSSWVQDMVSQGWLTEADVYEVQGTVELILDRARSGEITEHFARLVLIKLAKDKYQGWIERQGD
jgi:hypothetical protein